MAALSPRLVSLLATVAVLAAPTAWVTDEPGSMAGGSEIDINLILPRYAQTFDFWRRKDALFSVESHLTHNVAPRVWISADVLYRQGGETSTDGLADYNATLGWSAGGSLAVPIGPGLNAILTYQHVVARNDKGPDGWFFRTAFVAPL
jgi:hypothetical protein